MKLVFLVCCLCLFQCATPGETLPKGLAECFCGTIPDGDDQKCAIWEKTTDLTISQNVLLSTSGTCTPKICGIMGEEMCNKVVSWTFPANKHREFAVKEPCFCDEVIVTLDDEIFQVCASWQKDDKHLIEYYSVENCTPDACSKAPFSKSAEICSLGFNAFYQKDQAAETPKQ